MTTSLKPTGGSRRRCFPTQATAGSMKASGRGHHARMDVPMRGVPCEITRHGWLAEIALHDRGASVDLAAMDDAWARVFALHPTKIVIIDMTGVSMVDDALAQWLIESQRRAASLDAELVVLAPRGDARETLRRRAVGSVVTLVDSA